MMTQAFFDEVLVIMVKSMARENEVMDHLIEIFCSKLKHVVVVLIFYVNLIFCRSGSGATNATVQQYYNQTTESNRAANSYLQLRDQQTHHQQIYPGNSEMNRNSAAATPNLNNHIPLATMNGEQRYVPYQSSNNNNSIPMATNIDDYQRYQPAQYQQQKQQPRLKLKKDK